MTPRWDKFFHMTTVGSVTMSHMTQTVVCRVNNLLCLLVDWMSNLMSEIGCKIGWLMASEFTISHSSPWLSTHNKGSLNQLGIEGHNAFYDHLAYFGFPKDLWIRCHNRCNMLYQVNWHKKNSGSDKNALIQKNNNSWPFGNGASRSWMPL